MNDSLNIPSDYQRRSEALRKANQFNKATVFDALAGTGITRVFVTFDGEGDQGQIESLRAVSGDEDVELPDTPLTSRKAEWGKPEGDLAESTLPDAIELLCYDYLEVEHGGWEINEGSYGEFLFDVASRTITLVLFSRFVDATRHQDSL